MNDPGTTQHNNRRVKLVTSLLFITLFLVHGFGLYGSAGRDDVHITYWAADALVETGNIVNLNGERVEQSSSLLHVLLLALLYKITNVPIPTLAALLSILFGAATTLVIWRFTSKFGISNDWCVPLLLLLSPYFVYWSFGGLETTLIAFSVLLVVSSTANFIIKATRLNLLVYITSTACYLAVRPESIFVTLAFFAAITIFIIIINSKGESPFDRNIYQRIALLLGVCLAIFSVLTLWRYTYYEQIFPQPVYAKASGLQLHNVINGLKYVFQAVEVPSIVILTLLSFYSIYHIVLGNIENNKKLFSIVPVAFVMAYGAFVVTSGGDWMEGGRLLVPLIPLIVLLGVWAINRSNRTRILLLSILVVISISDGITFAKQKSTGMPFFEVRETVDKVQDELAISYTEYSWFEYANRIHLRDVAFIPALDQVVTKLLAEGVEKVSILSNQMGMVPYYIAKRRYKDVEFLDMRGLATKHFTECEITSDLPKTSAGIDLSYKLFFEILDEINTKCSISDPMIIFTLETQERKEVIQENGYVIIYQQIGEVTTPFGGGYVGAGQFIALRKDLATIIGEIEPPVREWPTP